MLEVLKYNNISISVNMTAVKYMLTYGYMLENVTFCQEIHRLLPGTKLSVTKDTTSYEIVSVCCLIKNALKILHLWLTSGKIYARVLKFPIRFSCRFSVKYHSKEDKNHV